MVLESNFNLKTFTHSDKADQLKIDNTILTDEQLDNLVRLHGLLCHIHGKLVGFYNKQIPIKINSAFRCPELNKIVKGSPTSDHMNGCSADTVAEGITIYDYFNFVKSLVKEKVITCDQCILEPTWVHISIREGYNREQFLKMQIINGKSRYLPA
jgi:zinc D-Ala-D-Ala carboxypeptidase